MHGISEVTKRVQGLLPSIKGQRQDVERARRLPLALANQVRETGIFALAIPRALGGLEASPLEIMRLIETVAAADGSTGWCAMVGLGNNVAAGYMREAGARTVFADPAAPAAGIAAPAGAAVRRKGGVTVSGRWSFASGITHSDWVWAGALIMENGRPRMTPTGPEIVHVCMPVKEIQIHDTWFVSGLCGTGSQDFSVNDLHIPDDHIFNLLDPSGHRNEPLYQMPPVGLFIFQLVSVSLGIARAALDELADIAQTKTPTFYQAVLADKSVPQVELARAEAALGGARAFLYETVESIWDVVRAGGAPSKRLNALGRLAANQVAETAARITRTAGRLAGGSAIYATSSLQRHARDAEAITHHFTVAPHVWEEGGRVLLGREPTIPVF